MNVLSVEFGWDAESLADMFVLNRKREPQTVNSSQRIDGRYVRVDPSGRGKSFVKAMLEYLWSTTQGYTSTL